MPVFSCTHTFEMQKYGPINGSFDEIFSGNMRVKKPVKTCAVYAPNDKVWKNTRVMTTDDDIFILQFDPLLYVNIVLPPRESRFRAVNSHQLLATVHVWAQSSLLLLLFTYLLFVFRSPGTHAKMLKKNKNETTTNPMQKYLRYSTRIDY